MDICEAVLITSVNELVLLGVARPALVTITLSVHGTVQFAGISVHVCLALAEQVGLARWVGVALLLALLLARPSQLFDWVLVFGLLADTLVLVVYRNCLLCILSVARPAVVAIGIDAEAVVQFTGASVHVSVTLCKHEGLASRMSIALLLAPFFCLEFVRISPLSEEVASRSVAYSLEFAV